jgi:hypothetical protein
MLNYLGIEAFRRTPLVKEPFEYLIVERFIGPSALAAINADYPKISSSGSFPIDELTFGPAFNTLLDELSSDEFREAFEEKFGVDPHRFDEQNHHRPDLHERTMGRNRRPIASVALRRRHR